MRKTNEQGIQDESTPLKDSIDSSTVPSISPMERLKKQNAEMLGIISRLAAEKEALKKKLNLLNIQIRS